MTMIPSLVNRNQNFHENQGRDEAGGENSVLDAKKEDS